MARAYLKISIETGMEREVCEALRNLAEVKSADLTTGDQDIIAVIEVGDYEALLKTISEEILPSSKRAESRA